MWFPAIFIFGAGVWFIAQGITMSSFLWAFVGAIIMLISGTFLLTFF
jgi:hypothetical protein